MTLRGERLDTFQELVAPEIVTSETLIFLNLFLDNRLCRDCGVVGAGYPERAETAHALIPNEYILDREHECVPHVEAAGDVRRREDDGVRGCVRLRHSLLHTLVRIEQAAFLPFAIEARLGGGGFVGF